MHKQDWKSDLKSLAGPILLPLVYFWRELTGLSVFAGFDFTHLILPFQQFARHAIQNGNLPEWNPYLFAGFPQLAEGEGGVFYPGNLLLWLPGDQSVLLSWTVVLHLILTGCLMYAFLRGRGASRPTAAWLAIFYQFLPGLILRAETVGLFQAVAWLPGLYWAMERAVLEGAITRALGWLKWVMLASAFVAFMLLAGSSQIAFYGLLGGFFYLGGLVLLGGNIKRLIGWGILTLLTIVVLAAVLSAVQTVPTSQFSQLSYRLQDAGFGYYRIGTWLNFPRLASLFLFPAVTQPDQILDYVTSLGYIGLLPCVLVGITLTLHKKYMNPILAPFMLVFFGVLLAFGLNIAINEDLITFPGFSMFRALGRMILPTIVAFIALAAVGLDRLYDLRLDSSRIPEIRAGIVSTIIVVLILNLWYLYYEQFPTTGFVIIAFTAQAVALVVIGIGLIGFLKTKNTRWLTGLLAAWLILQLASTVPLLSAVTVTSSSFNDARTSFSLGDAVVTDDQGRPSRVLVAIENEVWDPLLERLLRYPTRSGDSLPIPAFGNELSMGSIGILNGYTPLVTERWYEIAHDYAASGLARGDLTEASGRLRATLSVLTTDALVCPGYFTGGDDFDELDADLTGIFPDDWHVLNVPDPAPYVSIPTYVEAWNNSDWEWFKHWIVHDQFTPGDTSCVEIDEDGVIPELMAWGDVVSPAWEFDPGLPAWAGYQLPPDSNPEILDVERSMDGQGRISIRAVCDVPYWIVVRESAMPGWTASVDGTPAPVYTADYLFMAVPVEGGEHTVELSYRTPGLVEGMNVSIFGWVIWVLLLLISVLLSGRTGRPRDSRRDARAT